MQDIHSFETGGGGGGGRLFAGGGDRRLRHNHHHQDLNCPRCDSSNTKFCYYNNYNLSQPRHFCKSCRRYWTKGGVLRNVPVGGGIRKAKRGNKSKPNTNIPSSDADADAVAVERKSSNSENSSSDSSTPNTTATTTATDVSGSNSTNSTPATMINFNDSSRRFFNIPQSSTPITTSFDPVTMNQASAGNTSSEIGMFTGMMTSSTDRLQQVNTEHVVENHNQWTVETTGFMDQTAEIEGLFDLTGTVDQSYWNQNQWNDDNHDHHVHYIS